ncbi:MAG: efflux RND transporter periplasmic adaptor subunit [Actinomycetes bacterium]
MGHVVGVWRARRRATPLWLVVAVVVVVAVGAAGAAWAKSRGSGTTVTTALATVSKGTVRQTVSATGTLTPAQQADLSFAVSGTVTSVAVSEGDQVRAGDVLATVGRSALRADLDAAEASVTAASEQLSSDLAAAASDTALAADRANLRSARSSRRSAAEALADASLRSTVTGTVVSVDLAAGDQVSGSGGSAPSGGADTGTAAKSGTITVISTNAFDVDASVSAADLPSLKKGLQAQITPTGSRQTLFGTVSSVGLVAESSTSGTSTFPVSIAVTGKVTGVYAGSSATVSIIVRQLTDVLTVPTAAVHSARGRTTVTVSAKGATHERAVTLGDVFGAQTVVTKGLTAGDQVVIATLRLPAGATTNRTGNGQPGFGGGVFPGAGGGGPPGQPGQGGQGPQLSTGGGQ